MTNARLASLVSVLVPLLLTSCTSTYMGRWIAWNFSDIDDKDRFAEAPVAAPDKAFYFSAPTATANILVSVERRGRHERLELSEVARSTGTTALIVIRRDTLLFEGYFNGYGRESVNTSFSVAKSVTSLLVGMAIDQGLIGSLADPVTKYVPELARRDERFSRLTVGHLLDMRSGLRFRDHDLPWGDKPRAYYHPHLRKVVLSEIGFTHEPGEEWAYNSFNPILLGIVLERSTGLTPAELLEQWVWKRLGMEFPGGWSVDGTREPMVKMESGINARAIDFAKIGRLVLERGEWNGDRVVSADWVEGSTHVTPQCMVEAFLPRQLCYKRGWWLHPAEDPVGLAVGAWGHLGQYIYVFPQLELVMVRFGSKTGGVSWPRVFREVARAVAPADATVPAGM